ncbi:phage repressor protein [Photobacterium frigidiphilum]|uniref:Phage repressor protein n=1 Tax=Photobacterium frigidiphilum TaxID=264736 RepID=A0A2T3J748_9GAMM|nr:XRE family transcriptional regulator [Photobacterium frigidiphilum]PSU44523.1 phage repressor protein [Photobacterium frigidiphilum]
MNSIGERIRELRLKKRLTQKELATRVGVTPTAVSQWEREENEPKGKHLLKLSKELDVTVDWLTVAIKPPIQMLPESNVACVLVSFYPNVCAAGGVGSCVDDEDKGYAAIPTNIIKGRNIDDIVCIVVTGDSMEPIVPEGSIIALDRHERVIKDGKMYVFKQNGLLRIKSLKQTPYELIIQSYNKSYDDEVYNLSGLDDFELIGRVFWASIEV